MRPEGFDSQLLSAPLDPCNIVVLRPNGVDISCNHVSTTLTIDRKAAAVILANFAISAGSEENEPFVNARARHSGNPGLF